MSSTSPAKPQTSRPRLYAIDFVRICVITNVVAVHVLAQLYTTPLIGAIGILVHVNREIFLLISGFILSYSYGLRPKVDWARFYRRRYLLVGVPYLTWTIIYTYTAGQLTAHIGQDFVNVGWYLLNGRACYQLYFLLILMQLYLVFPLLRRFMNATKRHHLAIVAASAIWQIVFTALVQRSVGAWGPLGFWLGNPDPWLMSYLFYIFAGAAAAWHLETLLAWVERYRRRWGIAALVTAAAALLVYIWQLHSGMTVDEADTTFQPIIVIESVVFALALLAAGRHWEHSGARGKRWVMFGSVASFGVYLVHPLILELLARLFSAIGLVAALSHLPAVAVIALMLAVGLPLTVLLSTALAELACLTPLSLPLAGRPRPASNRKSDAQARSGWFHPKSLLDKFFEVSVIIKGVEGLVELFAGIGLLFLGVGAIGNITQLITHNELLQEPNDFFANFILHSGQLLASGGTTYLVLYLLVHAVIKLVAVVGLLRNQLWSYPFSLATLGLFMLYQVYQIFTSHSIAITVLTFYDVFLLWLIWREYQSQRQTQTLRATGNL